MFNELQKKNGYPPDFIRKAIRQQKRKVLPTNAPASPPSQKRISLPYVKGTSEAISRLLKKEGITVAHKPTNTINLLPKPRDLPPRERAQGVVYEIKCSDCQAAYIGETKNSGCS